MLKNSSLASLMAVAILFLVSPAQAQAVAQFDLPSQPLATALRALGSQTSTNVLFDPPLVEGRDAPALKAELTLDQAFARLLAGTGLKHRFLDDKTVMVISAKDTGVKPTAAASDVGPALRLAQEDQSKTEMQKVENTESKKSPGSEDSSESSDESSKGIPEILVVGSKSQNVDIPRSRDDVQPYVVIDRKKIENSSASTLEDFLKNELPMNAATRTFEQTAATSGPPQGSINLRGLGSEQTLILIDGRRSPGLVNVSGAFVQGDISGIPLSSIERIEVLPATAGAIYGGSATGGVINIIRKHDFVGADVGVKYGNTLASDARKVDYFLNGGFSAKRTSVTYTVTHSEGDPLLAADRDFGLRARALTAANVPSQITSSASPISSNTTNICAATRLSATAGRCSGAPLVLDNGQSLGTSTTFVPSGYLGVSSDGGAGLARNAGTYNLALPNDGQYILSNPTRNSLSFDLRHSFASWVEFQLSASRGKSKLETSVMPAFTVLVPATAANNPFNQDVLVNVPLAVRGSNGRNSSELWSASGGFIFRLPREWSVSLDHDWGRSRYSYSSRQAAVLSSTDVLALQSSNSLFQDVAQSQPNLPSANLSPDIFGGPFTQKSQGNSLRFAGPVVDLPGGAITLSGLAERRSEESDGAFLINRNLNLTSYLPPRSKDIDSLYLETNLPIVTKKLGYSLVDTFELQASVRRDRYKASSTSGLLTLSTPQAPLPPLTYYENDVSSTDYLVGFKYSPVRDITLRASWGTGFLPAGMNQLLPIIGTSSSVVLDPKRGGAPVAVPFAAISGGNPDLRPETSSSWSTGLIFVPRFLEGSRLSIDYTYIRKQDEITGPSPQFLVDNESVYSSRITRGPNLPTDPSGWAGPVTQIDLSLLNVLHTAVRSLDMQYDYVWSTSSLGKFSFSMIATQFREFTRKASLTVQPVDSVGYSDGPIRWRGTAGLGWELGQWRAAWSSQYYNGYEVAASTSSELNRTTAITLQGASSIPSQLYHDVHLKYVVGSDVGLFSGTTVSLGVYNVFDKSPPILALASPNSFTTGPYSQLGDPRLRRYVLSFQKSFGK